MVAETSELRSGITSAFNKRLNEALQFNPQMAFNIENTVTPSQIIGVLKGEQGTPGLPAAISAVKDDNNLVMLAVSPIERGNLTINRSVVSITGNGNSDTTLTVPAGKKWIIKGADIYKSTGTYTIDTYTVSITDLNSIEATLYNSATKPAVGTVLCGARELSVPAGWTILLRTTNSSYSVTGNTIKSLVYQELAV